MEHGTCNMFVAGKRCLLKILVNIVKEKYSFKVVSTDGRLILKCNLKKCDASFWNGLN
jgi:hypothetical protein